MTTPDFLSVDEVLYLHEVQLSRYGGGSGLRDLGALESAVAMPLASFAGALLHTGLFAMAAAYAFHIAQNQLPSTATSGRGSPPRLCFSISTG